MSNSVVKVTDAMLDDSLLLLVGEDGTVSPNKETVQSYLSSKKSSTKIQVMHINKSDGQSIDVSIDNLTFVPDATSECVVDNATDMDTVAQILHNINLDHDYTSLTAPPEEDELAKTLSILEGNPQPPPSQNVKPAPVVKPSSVSVKQIVNKTNIDIPKLVKIKAKQPEAPSKAVNSAQKRPREKPKTVEVVDADDDDLEESDEDYEDDLDDDGDSDFELEETRPRQAKKAKMKSKITPNKKPAPKPPVLAKLKEEEVKTPEKTEHVPELKTPDKKAPKKEKKVPKPIIDDFALFSTPDIIRRVGGKEPTTPNSATSATAPSTSELSPDSKPAKIENRSKSATESSQSPTKQSRLSLDGKFADKNVPRVETKPKQKRPSLESHPKRLSTDNQAKKVQEHTKTADDNMVEMPGAEDFRAILEESKAFRNSIPLDDLSSEDQASMALDSTGLDLDPSLLENINNDMISEDILYQVAQSLVSNTELQNAIDKSLNEGMVLDPTIQQAINQEQVAPKHEHLSAQEPSSSTQRGTQIVRPDGRIVVIPPIERPTTRSRNKQKEAERPLKFTHKPLDDEHVSGNELDSSGEDEEEEEEEEEDEEESEDDPNKLWCICNQPHNNRFMICCDTCEEWYHGKCVNITKAMGQQMESEGKEWICLFCKDPMLKRPQAAARRIRKASRNSRQSSDSAGSGQVSEHGSGSVPCVVCQKASRINSIFCSESCILAHAQGVERVVVFERSTGNMLTGNKAPSASNLEQWLKEHPGYEVVRSAGKVVTAKQTQNFTQSRLKLVKNSDNEGVSLAVQKKGISVGVLKHLPRNPPDNAKIPQKTHLPGFKIISKTVPTNVQKPKVIVVSKPESTPSTPIKPKIIQTTIKPGGGGTPLSKEKPIPVKTPKARQAEQVTPPPKQENIRENVQKTLFEQLTNRLKVAGDVKLSEDEVKNISTEIESQLYKCFGDTGQKYRNKYRSLIFNIKDIKNQTLWRRICEKSINPYQLVRLSPDDLASQELALWREREAKHQLDMIKKSELELLNCNRQYVLKTHKGEQVLEDNRPTDHIDNTEVITSLTESSHPDKSDGKSDTSKDRDKKSSKRSHKDKERKSSKEKEHHHHKSLSRDRDRSRKRSRSRDRSSKHGDRRRSRSRGRDRHRRSSHKSSKHKKDSHRGSSTDKLDKKSKEILEQLVDNKIVPPLEDRLWKHVPQEDVIPAPLAESDSDHEPTSTVTIPTPPRNNEADEYHPPTVATDVKSDKYDTKKTDLDEPVSSPSPKAKSEEIWRGIINMIDVAQISITAHEVSGDCNGLGIELPSNLDIVGRISPDTVWDYIGKMKCSNSKIISLVRLDAINVEEKMPYLALYSYLSSRNRLGVVKSPNKAVKDFYILPLASQKPIPQALLPISGPGFEESRPALLLGIVVRDKRKRPMIDSSSSSIISSVKKVKLETPAVQATPPQRSYTPPPVKDPRLKLPLPPSVKDEEDEPYSPEDSDPDTGAPTAAADIPAVSGLTALPDSVASQAPPFQPFTNKFDKIPGLENPMFLSSTQEIQRQMEKLNKEIEMQKSEINSISQTIATDSTEIGTSALANIALPSNLQQILDSIKTIGVVPSADATDAEASASNPGKSSDLTIPLILPTNFSRPLSNTTIEESGNDTIPLNLPKKKIPESGSVLSSLSEEDLIRKAAEMLGETTPKETDSSQKSS